MSPTRVFAAASAEFVDLCRELHPPLQWMPSSPAEGRQHQNASISGGEVGVLVAAVTAVEDVGKQLARARARDLHGSRRSGGGSHDQVGGCRIQPGVKEPGDDTDLPRVAGRAAAVKDERSRVF
jgi:hypothetical protein